MRKQRVDTVGRRKSFENKNQNTLALTTFSLSNIGQDDFLPPFSSLFYVESDAFSPPCVSLKRTWLYGHIKSTFINKYLNMMMMIKLMDTFLRHFLLHFISLFNLKTPIVWPEKSFFFVKTLTNCWISLCTP